MSITLIISLIAAACAGGALVAIAWILEYRQRVKNMKHWNEVAKVERQELEARFTKEKTDLVVACATFKKENIALKAELIKAQEHFNEANTEFIKLLQERDEAKAKLVETQDTSNFLHLRAENLQKEYEALERGNQELQLQIDAAPKEPRKPGRVKAQKAKEQANG